MAYPCSVRFWRMLPRASRHIGRAVARWATRLCRHYDKKTPPRKAERGCQRSLVPFLAADGITLKGEAIIAVEVLVFRRRCDGLYVTVDSKRRRSPIAF